MKTYQVHRLNELLELVKSGQPVPKRLLADCEACVARELEIKRRAGRRQAAFFQHLHTSQQNDVAVSSKQIHERITREEREDAEWLEQYHARGGLPTADDLRSLLENVDLDAKGE